MIFKKSCPDRGLKMKMAPSKEISLRCAENKNWLLTNGFGSQVTLEGLVNRNSIDVCIVNEPCVKGEKCFIC